MRLLWTDLARPVMRRLQCSHFNPFLDTVNLRQTSLESSRQTYEKASVYAVYISKNKRFISLVTYTLGNVETRLCPGDVTTYVRD